MQDLVIAIVQTSLTWEDIKANLSAFDSKLSPLADRTDLIILPEMFTTGFTMNAAGFAEPVDGPSVEWLRKKSALFNVDITGSLIIREEGLYYNRLFWAKPNGELFHYDKRHLFRMAGEDDVYAAGKQNITVEVKGWKVRPLICYDLRFPVWSRNKGGAEYDLLLLVANWPKRRTEHWKALLTARAIENQAYVAGVNRIGRDGNDIPYSGDSMIVDPLGKVSADLRGKDVVHTERLSGAIMENFREKFPAWKDGDQFEIM
jgi:omega-amidase